MCFDIERDTSGEDEEEELGKIKKISLREKINIFIQYVRMRMRKLRHRVSDVTERHIAIERQPQSNKAQYFRVE